MKKEKTSLPVYILLVLLCLAMNWAGDRFTGKMNLPFWFDSVGTVLIAYLAGPWCGAVVGACSGLLMHVIYGVNWIYSIIGIVIGIVVGVSARRGHLKTMLGTLTTGAVLAMITSVFATILNSIFNHGSTGNQWGDAVVGFFMELGFSRYPSMLIGTIYLELIDKVLILVIWMVIVRFFRFIWKRIRARRAEEEEEEKKEKKEKKTAGKPARPSAQRPCCWQPGSAFQPWPSLPPGRKKTTSSSKPTITTTSRPSIPA